jgi:O-antigen ligase
MVEDSLGPTAAPTRLGVDAFESTAIFLAIGAPALLAYDLSPSATVLNQAVAIQCWSLAVLAIGWSALTGARDAWRLSLSRAGLLLVALACLMAASLISPRWTGQPPSLMLSAAGTLVATGVVAVVGAGLSEDASRRLMNALCRAWLIVGALSVAIGSVQVLAPSWPDGNWIARPTIAGRAVGNLRQPNHYSSLLLWSAIAVVWLLESGALRRRTATIAFVAMIAGIVMSASRTGMLGVSVLAVWGLLDPRLQRGSRWLLMSSPLIYAACWLGLSLWAGTTGGVFGGAARLSADGDLSSSRFAIWSNTLQLIATHPWWGVGFGGFNFAWTLTTFPDRPVAFFDHAHNLPLHFAAELGLPLATVVLLLLVVALWRAFEASRRATGCDGTGRRCAFVMVLTMGLHSQLEYPLWYAYFLLPTALLWGLCLRPLPTAHGGLAQEAPSDPHETRSQKTDASRRIAGSPLLAIAGGAMLIGGVLVAADYMKVVAIFSPPKHAAPLPERIAIGQRSWFFSHHADYAAATTAAHPGEQLEAAQRAAHYLLDTRLMIAWSRAYAERGDLDRARHIAARLREFRNPDAAAFFAPCDGEAAAAPRAAPASHRPFQCEPPSRLLTPADFR